MAWLRRLMNSSTSNVVTAAAVMVAAAIPQAARASIDPVRAQALFDEAARLCQGDGGVLWHHSLCGPILLVDWSDNTAVANQADAGGVLKPAGKLFAGSLPADVVIANTPIEWSGRRWTELMWPLPDDVAHRHVTLSHELFHRAQHELDMPMGDGGGPRNQDAPGSTAGSIYDSVQRYGLKLEARKAPLDILIVDRVETMPTEN